MSHPTPPATGKRRAGWWIFLGLVAGVALTFGLLLLPPVQAWLLRRALGSQPGTAVDFSRVSVRPGGAEAADIKLRLPDLTVEARALRLAISPWQLVSRRRLAIAELQAKQLAIRTTPAKDSAPATPFTGLLDGLQAPLSWACSKAEADGTLIIEQTGAAPLEVAFALKGSDLDITKPGRIEFQFTTAGALVAGFEGRWQFDGTLDFVATPDEHIDRVVIEGKLSPAASAEYHLPPVHIRLAASRTAQGEDYQFDVSPAGNNPAATLSGNAAFVRSEGKISGHWQANGGSALASQVLRRNDLPAVQTDTRGSFALDTRSGAAGADVDGEFNGSDWQRYLPELSAVGRLHGKHSARVVRRDGQWKLEKLAATAGSDGSQAALQLALERTVALPPGGDGNTSAWAILSVQQLPMGWLAPVLGLGKIAGGEMQGRWALSSPNAGTVRATPLGSLESASFTVTDAALPKLPEMKLQADASLDLTATEAQVHVTRAALFSEAGDRIEGILESKADLDKLIADTSVRWQATLPTWLGNKQPPRLEGTATADVTENYATVRSFHLTAQNGPDVEPAFAIDTLAPLKIDYEHDTRVELPEGDFARLSSRNLNLDWATPLLPGLTLSGVLASGESTLRREGRGFFVATAQPWTLRDLDIAQGGLPLLRAPEFTVAPAGRVELDAEWVPRDFVGNVKLGGTLAEFFRLRDPSGPLAANGTAHVTRIGSRLELPSLDFDVRRHDQSPLLTLESLQPIVLGASAKNNDIDKAPDSLRMRTTAVPLHWLQPLLTGNLQLDGTLEPTEFVAKIDLPNAFLSAARPLAVDVQKLDDGNTALLRQARLELSPSVIVMGKIASLVVEHGRVLLDGREAGTAGLALMYFTNNLQIPISGSIDIGANVSLLRNQPVAATLPLPATGQARFIFSHDLTRGTPTTATFLLNEVQSPDGQGTLPRFGMRLTNLDPADGRDRIKLEFQYQTAPAWSAFTTEFGYAMRGKRAEINATLKGDFFDVSSFMDLVNACAPSVQPAAPATKKPAADTSTTAPDAGTVGAFWAPLLSKFDLEFGAITYGNYRIENLTGQFEINEQAIQLSRLAGKMFDGDWKGNVRLDYDANQPTAPFGLSGGFEISDFSAQRIVQAAYPNEIGSFDGRLHFTSQVSSRGTGMQSLLANARSQFQFNSQGGRLQLRVPHRNLASAALLVGGTLTFSPELRAIGRLVKKFSDLPVDELSARGRSEHGGAIFLDDFRLQTPQLRLSASGTVPAESGVELAARSLELPVTLAVKDEMAVLLKGMKLIGRKPDPDGFFIMSRQPVLRGTLGAPDTTDLYDVFAQAVSGSSGTFGFLMKKVQQEVEKSRTTTAAR